MMARIAWALAAAVPAGAIPQPRPLEPGSYEVFGEVRYLGAVQSFNDRRR